MQEISLWDIENIKIGHAQDMEHATGCTVLLCERGAPAGVDVRGGGPASRETELLRPTASCQGIHALLLSGGSAYGLDAAGGVMQYLEQRGVGFPVGSTVVPLVCASCLFDLNLVSSAVRPDAAMARLACEDAQTRREGMGNVGAGTGATVGKYLGPDTMMKSGFGCYAVQVGDLKVGAMVAVNALGDVFDCDTGRQLAGLLTPDHKGFAGTEDAFLKAYAGLRNVFTGNTTIGAVITNGRFDKVQMQKIASMAHNGYARAIRPVHTTADGDSIYGLSVGDVSADLDVVGTLSATVMARAIKNAVLEATSAYGLPAARDILD
ncbi:P1 family peptidase [Zongyangia hominis]|uniref:P1 family peptidase n=1 Tax=Zongyangia hominis TaxID=2763677 RepID=A0A926EA53_9FIRM|nr:P1 family peptidase [Zongyangia hominis]MBC8570725.1 P1 family peptidase [Zongyangia hominis]